MAPRPPAPRFRRAHAPSLGPCPLGHDSNAGLEAFARQNDTTLFVVTLAAFFALLHRYTGADDLVVGSPFASIAEETEGLIGFFVNTLPLRVRLSGFASFRVLLATVREVALGAFDHQELPMEALLRALQVPRSPSHSPLFQTVMAVRSDPPPVLLLPGLTLAAIDLDTGTAKFDLLLSLTAAERDLQAKVEYRSELFEAATAGRLIGHLATLLHGTATDPDRAVGEAPLLTQGERNQLTHEWNRPVTVAGPDEYIHRLYEVQACLAPEAIAITMAEGNLAVTYGELSRRADRLARRLRRLGARPAPLHAAAFVWLREPGRRRRRRPRERPPRPEPARRRRLRPPHLGLDRPPQGRGRHSPQRDAPVRSPCRENGIRRQRRLDRIPFFLLRFLGLGAVGGAAARWQGSSDPA